MRVPLKINSKEEVKKLIVERNIEYIKVGVFDIDGIFRGKYMAREKFLSALEHGFNICEVVMGWDSNDQLYDNVTYTGWHTGYGDASVQIVPKSCRELPMENNTILFLAEFKGQAEKICPRGLLKRVIQKSEQMGFMPKASCEFEFFLFDESPTTVRQKNYQNLNNISPGFFGYSMLRNSVYSDFYEELLDTCIAMDFPLEGFHTETGPGVMEAALVYDDAIIAADKASLFKTYTKILAQKREWMATFMAKWSKDFPGQSGHIHLSLQNQAGESTFYDDTRENTISDTMRYFIGGQQALMPELLSMVAPNINSYTRLIPGFWAPTEASWGIDNRTCAIRVILGSGKSQRVEYRISAADINPYIALAAALGSGLWGIENKIEPDNPIVGNSYDQEFSEERQLPKTLWEAAKRLEQSQAAHQLFGSDFVNHFAATRFWEQREFNKHITDWEMNRYFEII
jgi:glutamine synthetase